MAERLEVIITAKDEASGVLSGISSKFASWGTKLTAGVTAPITALGVMAVSAASSLSESMNKVGVVFGDAAGQVQTWSQTAATAFGQSQQQALEAAGTFGNLFITMGLGAQETADMSTSLV